MARAQPKGLPIDDTLDRQCFELVWIGFREEERASFRDGTLRNEWFTTYKETCFDVQDLQIATNQPKNHFFEWAGAVHWSKTLGWSTLIEKYQYKFHATKLKIFERVVPQNVRDFVDREAPGLFGSTQCPDLLVYSPDFHDWFFCETKGAKEPFTEHQVAFFTHLARLGHRRIKIARFFQELA